MDDDLNRPLKQRPRHTWQLSGNLYSIAAYGIVTYLKERVWARVLVGGLGFLCLVGFIITLIAGPKVAGILPITGGFMLMSVGLLLCWFGVMAGPDFQVTLPSMQASRRTETAAAAFTSVPAPAAALELDLSRLNDYYDINQSQAKSSFAWAVFAMLAGFATIIVGIWLFYLRTEGRDALMASLSTAAGIVANLVSSLFLYLYNKTQTRAFHYHKELAAGRRVAIAMKLAESLPESTDRVRATNRVIEYLLFTAKDSDAE